jgi:hypothetical protein
LPANTGTAGAIHRGASFAGKPAPTKNAGKSNVSYGSKAASASLVASTKATAGIDAVGVFVPEDPGAKNDLAKQGKMAFDFGAFWFKGQSIRTGQANVKPATAAWRSSFITGAPRLPGSFPIV